MSVYDTFMDAWNAPIRNREEHEEWPSWVLSAVAHAARQPVGTPGREEVEAFMIAQFDQHHPIAVQALLEFGLTHHQARFEQARFTARGEVAAQLAAVYRQLGWSWRESIAHLIPLARQGAIYFAEAGELGAQEDAEVADALGEGLSLCAPSARSPITHALLKSAGVAGALPYKDLASSVAYTYLSGPHDAPRRHALDALTRWRRGDVEDFAPLLRPLLKPLSAQRAEFRELVAAWHAQDERVIALTAQLLDDERAWGVWRIFQQLAYQGDVWRPAGLMDLLREAPERWVRDWVAAQGS